MASKIITIHYVTKFPCNQILHHTEYWTKWKSCEKLFIQIRKCSTKNRKENFFDANNRWWRAGVERGSMSSLCAVLWIVFYSLWSQNVIKMCNFYFWPIHPFHSSMKMRAYYNIVGMGEFVRFKECRQKWSGKMSRSHDLWQFEFIAIIKRMCAAKSKNHFYY